MNVVRSLSAAALAAAILSSAGVEPPRAAVASEPHELRFSEGVDVTTLNPLLVTVASTVDLGQLTMAHFVRFDEKNRPIPEVLASLPTVANGGVSADGRTITYRLRRGVRWSDGAPFDASDVVFTVGAILNPKNNISVRDAWDRVTGADAPDPYTVRFHLKAPYGSYLTRYFASDTTFCILPKHILGKLATMNEAPYNALPIGIGPFRYTSFRRGDAVTMEANPYYFRGRPKLSRIVYKLITEENTLLAQMQTGELDMWGTVGGTFFDRVRALPNIQIVLSPSQYMGGAYLNTSRAPLTDRRVRAALALATDRRFVLEKINHGAGVLTQSVVAPISRDYIALPLGRYDPAAAARALDAAGWKVGSDGTRAKDGARLAIQIALPGGYAPSQITAEFLRSSWQKLGIAVDSKTYADAQYFAPMSEGGILNSGKFDIALLSEEGGNDADVTALYGCKYAPPNGLNLNRFCDRSVDADLAAYGHALDAGERASIAARFQRVIDAATPTIVLYERSFIYASAQRVHGFRPGNFTAYDNFMNVDVGP